MPSMRDFYAYSEDYKSFVHLGNYAQDGDLPSGFDSTQNKTLGTVINQPMGRMNRRMVNIQNSVTRSASHASFCRYARSNSLTRRLMEFFPRETLNRAIDNREKIPEIRTPTAVREVVVLIAIIDYQLRFTGRFVPSSTIEEIAKILNEPEITPSLVKSYRRRVSTSKYFMELTKPKSMGVLLRYSVQKNLSEFSPEKLDQYSIDKGEIFAIANDVIGKMVAWRYHSRDLELCSQGIIRLIIRLMNPYVIDDVWIPDGWDKKRVNRVNATYYRLVDLLKRRLAIDELTINDLCNLTIPIVPEKEITEIIPIPSITKVALTVKDAIKTGVEQPLVVNSTVESLPIPTYGEARIANESVRKSPTVVVANKSPISICYGSNRVSNRPNFLPLRTDFTLIPTINSLRGEEVLQFSTLRTINTTNQLMTHDSQHQRSRQAHDSARRLWPIPGKGPPLITTSS